MMNEWPNEWLLCNSFHATDISKSLKRALAASHCLHASLWGPICALMQDLHPKEKESAQIASSYSVRARVTCCRSQDRSTTKNTHYVDPMLCKSWQTSSCWKRVHSHVKGQSNPWMFPEISCLKQLLQLKYWKISSSDSHFSEKWNARKDSLSPLRQGENCTSLCTADLNLKHN